VISPSQSAKTQLAPPVAAQTNEDPFLNLIVYSDSLAYRRGDQPQDFSFTYPFVLKELIEKEWGCRVNLLVRGWGGLKIGDIRRLVGIDSGYLGSDGEALSIAVLQFGIVDCAPQPFTYFFSPVLRKLPFVGQRIVSMLVGYRRQLQILWSYRPTSRARFKTAYAAIVRTCVGAKIRPIAIGLPLPPLAIEHRSPGFRSSVSHYNQMIRDVIPDSFCDIEQQMTESLRGSFLMSDGHHLTEAGHRLYASKIFEQLGKLA
jgi:hypothetical protein